MRRTLPPLPVAAFAVVALAPLPLLVAGLVQGGWLALAGLGYMTVLVMLIDQVIPLVAADAPEGAEFPAGDALLVLLGGLHLAALPLAVWLIAGPGGLALWERLALFLGFGLWFGQVSVPAAHELIHRRARGLFGLGVAVYVSLLFGHHASAHRLVHHRHVGSAADPNTARAGEGFYRFALRAWSGSFRAGWLAERALRPGQRITPYTVYVLGAAGVLGLAFVLAGWVGVAVWAGLAVHAQLQLLLSDYVQHYGLSRARRTDGRLEPVGPRHSWNARAWFSSALMLNAPRHSDHHAHPARPYPALRLPAPEEAPMLPWPLPVACSIALVPPLWKSLVRPRLAAWRTEA
ncbi:alkane 1-monooxygenase [Neotabrizicola shimadae]|uniref:Alkane 1-monooxygenase n=1 Tax=Neotabrizicola shimadae TaxID=2807096 RepID=A0A8G0ZYT7_9RHOB|nr:alkane 1-monooxygenase [Neotabrizicola shimadae]QYZ71430.1 alkane 1-monooxygenase [Neotabrizicola shimadae]